MGGIDSESPLVGPSRPLLPPSVPKGHENEGGLKRPDQPLVSTLPEPGEVSFKKASEAFLDPLKLAEIPTEVAPAKKKMFQKVRNAASNVAEFARGRPTTCALLVVGLAFLLIAVPALGLSLVGIGGITLAHVAIPLGLIFTVIMAYYGWAFINMAKHSSNAAKMKELFAQWGEDQTKLTRAPLEAERAVVIQAGQREIDRLHAEYDERRVEAEKALEKSLETRAELEKTRSEFLASLGISQPALPDEATSALAKFSEEATEGAKDVLYMMPELVLMDSNTELDIPAANSENVIKQKNILVKLKDFVVDHPLATGLLVIGIVILAVALPVSIYFFAGFTSIAIIGSLSAILIPQLIVYGLSFLYEAKNSLNIDRKKQFLDEHKPIQEVLAEFYEPRKNFIPRRKQDILQYGESIGEQKAKAVARKIRAETAQKAAEDEMAYLRSIMDATLKAAVPQVSPEAYSVPVDRMVQDTADGAKTVGRELAE